MSPWVCVLVYTLSIYAILPFARGWQSVLRGLFDAKMNVFINLLLLTTGLMFLLWFARRLSRRRLFTFIVTLVLSFSFAMQMELPEERIHLIQYGVLGYLCASAASATFKGMAGSLMVLALGLVIGVGDELIQGILPSRVFDWWDVSYNLGGVFVGLAVFKIVK
ncbi:MAG: VanZ family protein [Nitrospiria bacterium]